jgi:hypothetical protein
MNCVLLCGDGNHGFLSCSLEFMKKTHQTLGVLETTTQQPRKQSRKAAFLLPTFQEES